VTLGVMLKIAALLGVAVLIVAQVDAEETADTLNIVANQVTIEGRTRVEGPSHIKNIGQGVVQVRDTNAKTAVLLGTSTASDGTSRLRMMPVEGTGIALAPVGEKGGLFVSGESGHVGVNTNTDIQGTLHVSGDLMSDKLVAGCLNGKGPSVLLKSASQYHAIVLGTEAENGAQRYSLGRGTNAQRSMTFHAASIAEYDGAGKAPLMVYMSPEKVMAAINADTGNMYVSGRFELTGSAKRRTWSSGSVSNLDILGSVSLDLPQGQTGGASLFYPSSTSMGENPSFRIRSTNSPGETTCADPEFCADTFFISGAAGTGGARVGVNTVMPKTLLDVRGNMHVQSDSHGRALMYYPQTGEKAGFYICAGDPKPNEPNFRGKTRFFINSEGRVGINTLQPEAGLDIKAAAGANTDDANKHDVSITNGNLHVKDGIRHTNKKHMLLMDGDNIFHQLNLENSMTVGMPSEVKVSSGIPSEVEDSSNPLLHVQGTINPRVTVATANEGTAAVMLESGKGSWTLSQGSDMCLSLNETHGGKMPSFKWDTAGRLVVGGTESPPEYGIQIETPMKPGAPENSLMINKGNLILHGSVFTKVTDTNGVSVTWSLSPKDLSNLNSLGIKEKLGIGIKEPKFDMSVVNHRTASLGDNAFMVTDGEIGTLSFNEYSVLNQGRSERRIHDSKALAVAMRVTNKGKVEFDGTAAAGNLNKRKLFVVDPMTGVVTCGKFADIGFEGEQTNKTPLRVKGAGGDGKSMTVGTIAFGQLKESRGHVGASAKHVFLSATDEKKMLAIDQESGKVGVGTAQATEDITIVTKDPEVTVLLTTGQKPDKTAALTMKSGGNVLLTASGSTAAGKFEIKEFASVEFVHGGDPTAKTEFNRAAPEGAKAPVGTHFVSGKVGMGLENPEKQLHVNGNTWWQGKFTVSRGFGRASMMEMMESQSLLELQEYSSPTSGAGNADQDELDVVSMLEHMSKIVRKNKARLQRQKNSIMLLQKQLIEYRSRA